MTKKPTPVKYAIRAKLRLVKESTTIEKVKITASTMAENFFRDAFKSEGLDLDYKESFFIMMLNRANDTIGYAKISEGGCSGTVADGKVIFATALNANSHAIILCHNHPSGQLKPSDADRKLTKNMVEFGKMIDCPILDHIILTEDRYYSFAESGLI